MGRDTRSRRRQPSEPPAFSKELHDWLRHGHDKTLAGLNQLFGEKTFAIAFIILMALPALPLPTGGITHVTEIITMLLCLELIAGRPSVWLPQRWQRVDVSKLLSGRGARRLVAFIAWFERWSRRRWGAWLERRSILSGRAIILFLFTLAAFVAPPFSGLDTLPALGVVVMSLGLILQDALIVGIGVIAGVLGIGLEIIAGAALYDGLVHIF
ncbi:MAG TPA: exopolysaccharide biosynthesis protein [Candidatus Saccharimonadales bacterium]|nr:exopolysaccharide biosynthesis protein [Candidatus Saccharimonadales bacterium]